MKFDDWGKLKTSLRGEKGAIIKAKEKKKKIILIKREAGIGKEKWEKERSIIEYKHHRIIQNNTFLMIIKVTIVLKLWSKVLHIFLLFSLYFSSLNLKYLKLTKMDITHVAMKLFIYLNEGVPPSQKFWWHLKVSDVTVSTKCHTERFPRYIRNNHQKPMKLAYPDPSLCCNELLTEPMHAVTRK